jgi:RimJ/RimL family protein N-acetyltransferase
VIPTPEVALRLVPIGRSGTPARELPELSEQARDVCEGTARFYEVIGFVPPWIGYLGVVGHAAVGTCAFKGPPVGGRVEIAFFSFPGFEGRGVATAMARELLAFAATTAPEALVAAQTLPAESASTTVLRRLGFRFAGPVAHPEDGLVWEWHLQA